MPGKLSMVEWAANSAPAVCRDAELHGVTGGGITSGEQTNFSDIPSFWLLGDREGRASIWLTTIIAETQAFANLAVAGTLGPTLLYNTRSRAFSSYDNAFLGDVSTSRTLLYGVSGAAISVPNYWTRTARPLIWTSNQSIQVARSAFIENLAVGEYKILHIGATNTTGRRIALYLVEASVGCNIVVPATYTYKFPA